MSTNPTWQQYERTYCFENKKCNCETYHDGWVMQPMAVISSLPYCYLGILFAFTYIKRLRTHWKLVLLGMNLFATGLGSMFVHSSFIQVAELVDYGCIYLIMAWVALEITYPIKKLIPFLISWIFLASIPIAALAYFKGKGVLIYGIIFVPLLAQLIKFHLGHHQRKISEKYLRNAMISITIAIIFNFTDVWGFLCLDSYYLHGHTLWHLFSCLAMYFVFKYFSHHFKTLEAGK